MGVTPMVTGQQRGEWPLHRKSGFAVQGSKDCNGSLGQSSQRRGAKGHARGLRPLHLL
jgi:hypothetical protein